jgi:hypothetical protein
LTPQPARVNLLLGADACGDQGVPYGKTWLAAGCRKLQLEHGAVTLSTLYVQHLQVSSAPQVRSNSQRQPEGGK